MEQSSNQKLDINLLLQDHEAFENAFLSADYAIMNIDEAIDFDELHSILNEGKANEGTHFLVGNYEGGPSGSYMAATNPITNIEPLNIEGPKPKNEQLVMKKWNRRPRIQQGSIEAAQKKELNKIRNREAAIRTFEQKKAFVKWLESEVLRYHEKNANLKRLIEFTESSISSDISRKQLRRTASLDWCRSSSKNA